MKLNELEKLIERQILAEANQGDIVEGLFALGLALRMANPDDPNFDKKFNSWRKKLNPDEKMTVSIRPPGPYTNDKGVTDYFEVELVLRLKSPKTCAIAFGRGCADFENLPASLQGKIGTIKDKIMNAGSVDTIVKARNEFLNNSTEEYVKIRITADGAAGELTKGALKGDVMATIEVGEGSLEDAKSGKIKLIPQQSTSQNWSVKSDSKTAANLGPEGALLTLADTFKSASPEMTGFIDYWKDKSAKDYEGGRYQLVLDMWNNFTEIIMSTPDSQEFDDAAYEYIKKAAFGEDATSVIQISANAVKEIEKGRLSKIMNDSALLRVETLPPKGDDGWTGATLLFLNVCPNEESDKDRDRVFSMRIKMEKEKPGKSAVYKLMIEFGGPRSQIGMDAKKFKELQSKRGDCSRESRTGGGGYTYGDERVQTEENKLTKSKITYKMLEQMVEEAIKKAR
jgi:hypothetical protein